MPPKRAKAAPKQPPSAPSTGSASRNAGAQSKTRGGRSREILTKERTRSNKATQRRSQAEDPENDSIQNSSSEDASLRSSTRARPRASERTEGGSLNSGPSTKRAVQETGARGKDAQGAVRRASGPGSSSKKGGSGDVEDAVLRRLSQHLSPKTRKASDTNVAISRPAGEVAKAPPVPGHTSKATSTVHATPLAADNSFAALANFKRRPRQPSLLHALANPTDGDTSLTLETTMDSEDLEATNMSIPFNPHDEGTPLPASNTATASHPTMAPMYDDDDLYTVSPQPKRGLKRKSDSISKDDVGSSAVDSVTGRPSSKSGADVVEVPASQQARSTAAPTGHSSTSPLSELPSSPPRRSGSSTPRRASENDDIYADPVSSSPPPPSSTSSLAKSPPKRAALKSRSARDITITSAALRALLPRKQRRQQSYDVSLVESDDGSSDSHVRKSSKKSSRSTKSGRGGSVLAESMTKKNQWLTGNGAKKKGKGRLITARAEEKENAGKRIYGRRRQADDSNEVDQSEASDGAQADKGLSKELQAARDKFRRIDEGSLDFESASLTGGSSPWR